MEKTEIQPQCQSTSANKSAPPLPAEKELIFNIALESGELDRGATFEVPSAIPGPIGEKCSTCQTNKPYNQSWPEHNRSESHIRHLILSRGFGPGVENLNREPSNILTIKCNLFHTNYRNALFFNAHKDEDEHRRRVKELHRLVHLPSSKGVIRRWNKVTRPRKTNQGVLSKTLGHFKKYSKRSI